MNLSFFAKSPFLVSLDTSDVQISFSLDLKGFKNLAGLVAGTKFFWLRIVHEITSSNQSQNQTCQVKTKPGRSVFEVD
ncbi:MAG: hypothetical protein DRQ49_14035 [Gammaproteobacteria bacterium]|nr:MAG: hypothetical protein DRQ49_14035 [Gammaproteobacteria bacterium]RKZ43567.1 MAG: hypothetical protein DRQ41_04980 [Gammaproteobacteria bacterium]RKZ72573.1 MAG: hypothetical protein DRQ57_17055 [Gammaproteobacteria bacterium]